MISLKTNEWEINNIDTILFDKDGTFIDLHYFWGKMTELRVEEIIKKYRLDDSAKKELCLKLGYDLDTEKMLSNGITALYSRQKILAIFKNDLRQFDIYITETELEEVFDKVSNDFYENMQEYTKPIEDAIEFIKKIKELNIKTAVVTADSILSTQNTLKQFGWEKLFDIVIGRESTKGTKESGEPAKLALKELNSSPKTTIMIGDAPTDYTCATNAGIEKTILVASGQIEKIELEKISNYKVKTLADIEII